MPKPPDFDDTFRDDHDGSRFREALAAAEASPPIDPGPAGPDGPDVRLAKEAKPDPLAHWHVAAVVERLCNATATDRVAPLPGGYDDDGPGMKQRDGRELLHDKAPPAWPQLRRKLRAWSTDTVAVLVGHTGRGKSSMAVQLAEAAARAGTPVLYASMEMSAEELACRLIALRGDPRARWSTVKHRGYPAAAVEAAGANLVAAAPHLYLWAPGSTERNAGALSMMARAVHAKTGRPVFVVLDYVQRLTPPDNGADNRRGAVADLSGQLRDLSRPAAPWPGCAILALSSTARANYGAFSSVEELLKESDLEGRGKESGELEYDAPILLCMTSNKPDDDAPDADPPALREAVIRVVKNREGNVGKARMRFEPARGMFTEWTDEEVKANATHASEAGASQERVLKTGRGTGARAAGARDRYNSPAADDDGPGPAEDGP